MTDSLLILYYSLCFGKRKYFAQPSTDMHLKETTMHDFQEDLSPVLQKRRKFPFATHENLKIIIQGLQTC